MNPDVVDSLGVKVMAGADARMVRAACRSVFNAASLLKGALRRARNVHAQEDTEEIEDLRQTLGKEVEEAEGVLQKAAEANEDTSRLKEALATGRLRLSELIAGSSHGGSETAPTVVTDPPLQGVEEAVATPAAPNPEGKGSKGKKGPKAGAKAPAKGRQPAEMSEEELQRHVAMSRVQEQMEMEMLQARMRYTSRLAEVAESMSVRPASSRGSQAASKSPSVVVEGAGPEPSWQVVGKKGQKNPPTLPAGLTQAVSPEWVKETAEVTATQNFADAREAQEDVEAEPMEAMLEAFKAFLSKDKGEKRKKMLQDAAKGAGEVVQAATRKEVAPNAVPTAGARPQEAARPPPSAVAGEAAWPGPTALDRVKLMERKRPVKKFTGQSGKVDFDHHMKTFKKAIDIPGLEAEWKLAELSHWFGGVAHIHVSKFLRREDAEAALQEALDCLNEEYSENAVSAVEMLASSLAMGKISPSNKDAVDKFVSSVMDTFVLAQETARDSDFQQPYVIARILAENVPHLRSPWADYLTKKKIKRARFEDFVIFLEYHRQKAGNYARYDFKPDSAPTAKVGAAVVDEEALPEEEALSFAAAAAKVATPARAAKPTPRAGAAPPKAAGKKEEGEKRTRNPPPCVICKEMHSLGDCPKFVALKPDERASFVIEKKRCRNCLKSGHELDKCWSKVRCSSCQGDHHALLHEKVPTTEDKEPTQA